MSVKMNGRHLAKFVADDEFDAIFPQVSLAHETLHGKTGPGSDFLGWVDLPVDYDKEEFARIKKAAAKIQSDSDVLVVIGIGGSYLGARAAIEALKGTLYNNTCKGTPQIFYVGNSRLPAERAGCLRRQGYFRERHFQIRHHDRAGAGVPHL